MTKPKNILESLIQSKKDKPKISKKAAEDIAKYKEYTYRDDGSNDVAWFNGTHDVARFDFNSAATSFWRQHYTVEQLKKLIYEEGRNQAGGVVRGEKKKSDTVKQERPISIKEQQKQLGKWGITNGGSDEGNDGESDTDGTVETEAGRDESRDEGTLNTEAGRRVHASLPNVQSAGTSGTGGRRAETISRVYPFGTGFGGLIKN